MRRAPAAGRDSPIFQRSLKQRGKPARTVVQPKWGSAQTGVVSMDAT